MWNPRISSLGGIFIGEEGSEQCGTDGDTFSHLSALQWGVFWCFSLQSGVFSSSQWGFVFSFSVGSIFFSVSGSFFSVGSGGRLQLPSVKRRSIKLVRPLLQYNIDLLCEYNYLRRCIDLLLR